MGRIIVGLAVALSVLVVGLPAAVVKLGAPVPSAPPEDARATTTLPLRVYLPDTGEIAVMDLEGYVAGVVAAEMPAEFHPEALKAQAVLARTYAVRRMRHLGGTGCDERPEADICAAPEVHQAWASDTRLRERWGDAYAVHRAKVAAAVQATAGEILTYRGVPAESVYHSTSGGHTADAAEVWGQPIPYLKGVPSPGEEGAPRYASTVRLGAAEAEERLGLAAGTLARLLGQGQQPIRVLQATRHGRAMVVAVGGKTWRGTDFRQALGLASAWFTVEADGTDLVFQVRGWGHGVGMSQYGANAMAAAGADYRAILAHYFPGTAVEPVPE